MITITEPLLSGQCILITGGTTPIGTACATLLSAHHALVLISGEDQLELEATLQFIRSEVPGCNVIGYAADLTSEEGVIAFFLHARIAFPGVAAVVINPATIWGKAASSAYRRCVREAAEVMSYRKSGDIFIVNDQSPGTRLTPADVDAFRQEVTGNRITVSLIETAHGTAQAAESVLRTLAVNCTAFKPGCQEDLI